MKRTASLHSNVNIWYWATFFSMAAFMLPVWIIYGREVLGFSNTQTVITGVLPYGLSFLLEVPTGSWADRFGRARVYQAGTLLYAISMASFIFVPGFYVLALFQIVGALGLAMQSGSSEALVHDSLPEEHKQKLYKQISGRRTSIMFISRALTVLMGGFLYTKDPRLPFVAATVFNLVGLAVSLRFREVRLEQTTATSSWAHISETFRLMRSKANLAKIVLLLTLFTFCAETLHILYQPYLKSQGVPIEQFGAFYFLVAVGSAAGALVVGRLMHRHHIFSILNVMILGVAFALVLLAFQNKWLVYPALIVSAVMFGCGQIVKSVSIQEQMTSRHQATALSIASFFMSGAFLLSTIGVGVLLDLFQVMTIVRLAVGVSAACAVLFIANSFVSRVRAA